MCKSEFVKHVSAALVSTVWRAWTEHTYGWKGNGCAPPRAWEDSPHAHLREHADMAAGWCLRQSSRSVFVDTWPPTDVRPFQVQPGADTRWPGCKMWTRQVPLEANAFWTLIRCREASVGKQTEFVVHVVLKCFDSSVSAHGWILVGWRCARPCIMYTCIDAQCPPSHAAS